MRISRPCKASRADLGMDAVENPAAWGVLDREIGPERCGTDCANSASTVVSFGLAAGLFISLRGFPGRSNKDTTATANKSPRRPGLKLRAYVITPPLSFKSQMLCDGWWIQRHPNLPRKARMPTPAGIPCRHPGHFQF